MPQRKLDDTITSSLYTSASCMDFRQRREDDFVRERRPDRQLQPNPQQQTQRGGQLPYSSPLPQTQWTAVPPAHQRQEGADLQETSLEAIHQRPDPMSAWRARPQPQSSTSTSRVGAERLKTRRLPRIFRRQETAESPQQQPVDVTMLYPQMSPYDSNRMSTYSAPEQMEHAQYRSVNQPGSPGFVPSWSALPSRSDEVSSIGIPRSPTYPPTGRRRMDSTIGVGDAAFEDEEDFRLFVEATAGLPPDIGFSLPRSASSPTQSSPRRRAARQSTPPTAGTSEVSPVACTPTTMSALQHLAGIPEANQTYRADRSPLPQSLQPAMSGPPQRTITHASTASGRAPLSRSDTSRERLQASASGLDLWLPTPMSPPTQSAQAQQIPRRSAGSTAETAYTAMRPITPVAPASSRPSFGRLDRETERQLEELALDDETEGRDYDDELPNYAQSQAEAQAERRAEAARRAQELQDRWLRRGR